MTDKEVATREPLTTDAIPETIRASYLTIDDLTTLATNEDLRASYFRELSGQLNNKWFDKLADLCIRQADVYRSIATRFSKGMKAREDTVSN